RAASSANSLDERSVSSHNFECAFSAAPCPLDAADFVRCSLRRRCSRNCRDSSLAMGVSSRGTFLQEARRYPTATIPPRVVSHPAARRLLIGNVTVLRNDSKGLFTKPAPAA